jgi:DNA (cytosine-5)-methyltransferase 1
MTRPRLLDCCCGEGGAAQGYHDAGFDVVGVDTARKRLPDGTWVDNRAIPERYPFEFIKADAFEVLADKAFIAGFDAVHASWPCQAHSVASKYKGTADRHKDLLTPGREAMTATGLPWVIENVPGAPMRADYLLCGCMFGLPGLRRERWFETSWRGFAMNLCHEHSEPVVTVAGHGPPSWVRSEARPVTVANWKRAMGIGWMTRDGLAQAIPPAYTRFIGAQLLSHLEARSKQPPAA